MIVVQILAGVVFGLVAFFASLFLGASVWFAIGLYVVVGTAALIGTPAVFFIVNRVFPRAKPQVSSDLQVVPECTDVAAGLPDVPKARAMSILAVDDDPFILELIPLISAKVGFSDVVTVSSGAQALDLLQWSEKIFDCLLLDISMPDMDGIELCRRVRMLSRYRETPIVMLTAMRDLGNIGEAFRAGATDYATKPFDIEDLGVRLRLAQDQSRRRADPVGREAAEGVRDPQIARDPELTATMRLGGAINLVDTVVMSNYLTQLPRKEMTEVKVFAIRIDRADALRTRISAQRFTSLREDLVAVVETCFVAQSALMSFVDDSTLIVAANAADSKAALKIETDIERHFAVQVADLGPEDDLDIGVSVGGPVQLEGAKADRAMRATDRAIGLVVHRALTKQGRALSGLSKKYI